MKKGKNFETEYFIREDSAAQHKNKLEQQRKNLKTQDEALKALHFMKCPKCGHDLITKRMSYIDIEQCTSCGVLVLEANNVDKFIAEEKSILKTLIDLFKS